ncbi:MAG TPA: HIT domain-containing protein [Mycobacteriales bacterium]|nr:HIT domain-containing protein [Mycobacteriales bacterium]
MSSDCLFCRVVAGEIPSTTVRESEHTIAFRDITPQAPVHVLVVPREHLVDVAALSERPDLLHAVVGEAAAVAAQEGLVVDGWRLLFNTGANAGQTVFHVHAHVLGGEPLGGLRGQIRG